MRIGFLLGAGVSIPAGALTTQALTEKIRLVGNYDRYSDGTFVMVGRYDLDDHSWRSRVRFMLELLDAHCRRYFNANRSSRDPNYEDWFYAANQLNEHLSEEYENPAIEPFVEKIVSCTEQPRDQLKETASLVCEYISDVVALELKLKTPITALNHLTCLVDATKDATIEGCDIFTLNHDLLIENVLESNKISFVDGFEGPDGDIALWKKSLFDEASPRYFLKLHGSINWFSYVEGLAKFVGPDRDHASQGDGRPLNYRSEQRPLIGTFNKIRDYIKPPYFELFATFRRQMGRIQHLYVSGYSFGDKGINTILVEWLYGGEDSKLWILHENEVQLLRSARGAIRNLWGQVARTKMDVYPSYLEKCEWQELREKVR